MARGDRQRPRVLRKDRTGANPVAVGAIALVTILVVCFFAFRKENPLTTPFEVNAVFQSSNGVRAKMPVRIAGVDVGKVTAVSAQPGTQATVISMAIEPEGLPIHKNAQVKIRPRLFLEGSYYLDLQPGTPDQPALDDGDTVPLAQTAIPVQLDQILTTLQQDTRENVKGLLQGAGDGLTRKPTAEDDATQDPSVRGRTAAQALNRSLVDAPDATRGLAVVNSAIVGQGNDVSAAIKGLARVGRSLSGETRALQDGVVSLNRTMGALADESSALSDAVAELPGALKTTNAAFDALNAAFPPVRALSREILPGVAETQATIDAARPWITQARALLGEDELGELVGILTPAARDLAKAGDGTVGLLEQQDLLAQCATKVILPTGNVVIEDGPRTTGVESYKALFYAFVGFNGEAQNFDGNGQWLRSATGGVQRLETGTEPLTGLKLYGNAQLPPRGTRPAMPTKLPTQNFRAACKDQERPDLNSARTGLADGQSQRPGRLLGYGPETAETLSRASASAASARPRVSDEDLEMLAARARGETPGDAPDADAIGEQDRARAEDDAERPSAEPASADRGSVADSASDEPGSVAGGLLGVLNPLRDGEGSR